MTRRRLPWYEEFFKDDYLKTYGPRLTEEVTAVEVAFVERVLGLNPGDRVLDLCCGNGRHALLLARHGFQVAGQDLSKAFLEEIAGAAQAEGLSLEVVHADMRQIPFTNYFDAVINMFTSFGYLETEAEDLVVLRQMAKALKPEGRLFMDLINREWVIANYIQNEWHEDRDGLAYLEHREFDLVTSRNHVSFTIVLPDGSRRHSAGHHVRLYSLTETMGMLEQAGLIFESVYGGFEGESYSVATRRMIVVARKSV